MNVDGALASIFTLTICPGTDLFNIRREDFILWCLAGQRQDRAPSVERLVRVRAWAIKGHGGTAICLALAIFIEVATWVGTALPSVIGPSWLQHGAGA